MQGKIVTTVLNSGFWGLGVLEFRVQGMEFSRIYGCCLKGLEWIYRVLYGCVLGFLNTMDTFFGAPPY